LGPDHKIKGDCHGKSHRVLHTEELPKNLEVRSSAAMRKGHRVLLADKEISLAATGFRIDSGEGK
jgi:hypothetical protein